MRTILLTTTTWRSD